MRFATIIAVTGVGVGVDVDVDVGIWVGYRRRRVPALESPRSVVDIWE